MLITFRPKICETGRLEGSSWPGFVRRLVGGGRVGDPREFYFWRFDKCTLESSAAAGAGLEFFIGGEFLILLNLCRPSSISVSNYFRTKMILIMRKGEKDMERRLTSIYLPRKLGEQHTYTKISSTYIIGDPWISLSKRDCDMLRLSYEINHHLILQKSDWGQIALGSVGCLFGGLSPCSGSHI